MASIAKGSCLDDVASVTSKTRLGTQDPGYTIVVTNQIGREVALDGTYDRVVEMIGMYEPWITYAPYVEVKKVLNTEYDFNCYVRSTLSDGRKLTDCDQKLVYKTVKEQMGEKEADAVVLTVADGKASSEQSNVIITGEGVSAGVLAHEFGHLTGDLRDEYVYSEGDVQGGRIKVYDPQPNCFASKEDCDAVMSKYRYTDTDYCMRGCQTNDYWRPTSRGIMSTSRGASSYGGFETCLMAQAMEEQIIVRVPNFEPSRSFCARGY
jgi:ribosomal protein S16